MTLEAHLLPNREPGRIGLLLDKAQAATSFLATASSYQGEGIKGKSIQVFHRRGIQLLVVHDDELPPPVVYAPLLRHTAFRIEGDVESVEASNLFDEQRWGENAVDVHGHVGLAYANNVNMNLVHVGQGEADNFAHLTVAGDAETIIFDNHSTGIVLGNVTKNARILDSDAIIGGDVGALQTRYDKDVERVTVHGEVKSYSYYKEWKDAGTGHP